MLPPAPAPPKRRKKSSSNRIEEISFDPASRQEYLTGFHKRKLARIKHAQQEAEKKARAEKIEDRKRLRDARKEELRLHVAAVNESIGVVRDDSDDTEGDEDERWDGLPDANPGEHLNGNTRLDEQDEFIDEDKYTTVTITTLDSDNDESANSSDNNRKDARNGSKPENDIVKNSAEKSGKGKGKDRKPKQKKKKFRYLSKAERKDDRMKEKARRGKKASFRREKAV